MNDVDEKRFTALYLAVQQGNSDVVRCLLSNGADVSIKMIDGWSVYHKVAYDGNFEIMKALVQYSSEYINDTDGVNETPVVIASRKGHLNIVQLLLERNASLDNVGTDSAEDVANPDTSYFIKIFKIIKRY